MGPLLLAQLLELNDVQEGILNIAFRVADDNSLPVIDLKDLRSLLNHCAENEKEIDAKYGNVSKDSVGTIQRQLLRLENQGAQKFFGEPALDINDFMKTDRDGRGIVNILAADKLIAKPRLYASFLLWMLSELFEQLPEVGDRDKPKLVFFFDEAHLLFNDAPRPLMEAVEQVVRLIRSKGVGVYFVTQNPLDVPQTVLGQLGTASSTRCVPTRRAIGRPSGRRRKHSCRTPRSRSRPSSPSSASARRSCPPFRTRACRCRSSARLWRRLAAVWAPSPRKSERPCGPAVPWEPSTTRASIASRHTRFSASGPRARLRRRLQAPPARAVRKRKRQPPAVDSAT
jgi:hypothetical protein